LAVFSGTRPVSSTVAYAVLLLVLLGLYRFTAIGLDRVPDDLACSPARCGPSTPVALTPAPRSRQHLLVPIVLDGHALAFLLDTGAASTVLDASVADDLGLLPRTRPILGAVNARYGWQRILPVERLIVAGHGYGHFDVALIDMTVIRAGLGRAVAGVLGADVLGLQPTEIDFAARTLALGIDAATFAAARPTDTRDTVVPIEDVSGGWFVRAQADDRAGFFLIDTGSNVSQISDALAAEVGGVTESRGRSLDASAARESTLRSTRLGVLAVGDLGRRDFEVAVGSTSLLGADFFAGMLLRVDAPAGIVTLRAHSRGPAPAGRPGLGSASGPGPEAVPGISSEE